MAEIEQQLRGRAHNTAIAALEVVPFAMLIADGSAQVLAVNGKWMELTGLGRANSLGPGWLSVLDPEARARLREDVLRVAREGGTVTVDYEIGGGPLKRWTRWWISRHELDGIPLVAIAAADVDDDYARQANLYHLATHDSLTGLINRSHFIECIDQALLRSQRQARRVAVVYVDLDGFKGVNDRGGHSLGDRVLFAIASRLRHAVRAADMVARIGGDEFAVLCEGLTASEQADVVARRIALALSESVELDGERWSVAASVGAAVDRGDPDSAEALVDRADRAMYSVKHGRRAPDGEEPVPAEPPRPVPQPERRSAPNSGYAYHAPVAPGSEAPAVATAPTATTAPTAPASPPPSSPASSTSPAPTGRREAPRGGLGVLDPDEARRALRDLAEAAGAFAASEPEPETAVAPPEDRSEPARNRLAADVVSLRESIDSIRRMLDRLLSAEGGVIDIRESADS